MDVVGHGRRRRGEETHSHGIAPGAGRGPGIVASGRRVSLPDRGEYNVGDAIEAGDGRIMGFQMVDRRNHLPHHRLLDHQTFGLSKTGEPVTEIRVRSLMILPGIPDILTRTHVVEAGEVTLIGRAWAGQLGVAVWK